MVDEAFGELDEIITARVETTRFAGTLHGGQNQPRERADDRNDHEHLHEGEGTSFLIVVSIHHVDRVLAAHTGSCGFSACRTLRSKKELLHRKRSQRKTPASLYGCRRELPKFFLAQQVGRGGR